MSLLLLEWRRAVAFLDGGAALTIQVWHGGAKGSTGAGMQVFEFAWIKGIAIDCDGKNQLQGGA